MRVQVIGTVLETLVFPPRGGGGASGCKAVDLVP